MAIKCQAISVSDSDSLLLTWVDLSLEIHQEQLISLILKVAKEQGYCFPGNKVMLFTVENEGQANEVVSFSMIDIDEEWRIGDWETNFEGKLYRMLHQDTKEMPLLDPLSLH